MVMNPTVQNAKKDKIQILVRILGSEKLYGGCWETVKGWKFAWGPDWGDHTKSFEKDADALRKVRKGDRKAPQARK